MTGRVEDEVVPRLRGVIHAHALWIAAIGGIVLVVAADGGRARLGASIYAVGLCALFLGSALYHRWPGDPRWRPLLRRIDHSTIFVFIAATYTPVALLTLTGTLADVVLVTVWVGAAAGVLFSIVWITAPRGLVAGTYIALGWVAVAAFPQLVDHAGAAPTALIVLGGILYSAGAAVYAAQRPNPWPAVFGFHEVFHTFVTAAALVHFIAIAGWIVPLSG